MMGELSKFSEDRTKMTELHSATQRDRITPKKRKRMQSSVHHHDDLETQARIFFGDGEEEGEEERTMEYTPLELHQEEKKVYGMQLRLCCVEGCQSRASRTGKRCGTHALVQKCRDEQCKVMVRSFDSYCRRHRPCRRSGCSERMYKRRFCRQHFDEKFGVKPRRGGHRPIKYTDDEMTKFIAEKIDAGEDAGKVVRSMKKERHVGHARAVRLVSGYVAKREETIKQFVVRELASERASLLSAKTLQEQFTMSEDDANRVLADGVAAATKLAQSCYRGFLDRVEKSSPASSESMQSADETVARVVRRRLLVPSSSSPSAKPPEDELEAEGGRTSGLSPAYPRARRCSQEFDKRLGSPRFCRLIL